MAEDFATLTFEVVEISNILTENIITAQVQFNLDDGRVANLRGKVDTGAQGNILPIRLFRQMFPERVDKTGRPRDGTLRPSTVILKAYGETNIPHLGECVIDCCLEDKRCGARFFVTDNHWTRTLRSTAYQGPQPFGHSEEHRQRHKYQRKTASRQSGCAGRFSRMFQWYRRVEGHVSHHTGP